MTMLSFRIDDATAEDLGRWAEALGIDRSELLREAVRRMLVRLRSETDAERWLEQPSTEAEAALADVAAWGPAEDWTDWHDAAR
jgi:predicted transcriptional regulator